MPTLNAMLKAPAKAFVENLNDEMPVDVDGSFIRFQSFAHDMNLSSHLEEEYAPDCLMEIEMPDGCGTIQFTQQDLLETQLDKSTCKYSVGGFDFTFYKLSPVR